MKRNAFVLGILLLIALGLGLSRLQSVFCCPISRQIEWKRMMELWRRNAIFSKKLHYGGVKYMALSLAAVLN